MIPVVKIILENDEGKILAVKETESGKWELPGGKIDDDETRFEAARRELLEEADVENNSFEDVVRVEIEDEKAVNCWIVFGKVSGVDVNVCGEELEDFKWVEKSSYRDLDLHSDASYCIPAVEFLDKYLG